MADAGGAAGAGAAGGALGNVSGPFWPQPATRPAPARQTTAMPVVVHRAATLIRNCRICRSYRPQAMDLVPTPLTDSQYHALTGALLAGVEATVDRWLQDDVVDVDTQRTGGLLELAFPDGSKIVLNTQPPLQEMWMAARSGGYHYKHVAGYWRDTRDGSDFFDALSACASQQAGQDLRFSPTA